MLDITHAAKTYLKESPDLWCQYVDRISSVSAEWINEHLDQNFSVGLRESFYESVFEKLLAPSLIDAFSSTEYQPTDFADLLVDIISSEVLELSEEDEYRQSEIVDYTVEGGTFGPIYAEDVEEGDYETSEIPMTAYTLAHLEIDRSSLAQRLRAVLAEPPDDSNQSNIFRLEYIDAALYAALISNPELMNALDWRKFEELLADIFFTFGYEVELQQGSKDGGVDLFVASKSLDLGE